MNNDLQSVPAVMNSDELSAAEETAKEFTNKLFIHKFVRPVTYNGKEYRELAFDWWKLTGADGLDIENEMQMANKPVIVPAFSGEYLARLSARACTKEIGIDFFKQMSLADFNRIRGEARSFLLNSES